MDLAIVATGSSPHISTDSATATVEIRGESYPENAFELYAPLLAWVEQHLAHPEAGLTLNLYLLYLNTSSVKSLMDLLDLLQDAHQRGQPVVVNWYYEAGNQRAAELAEEFKEDCYFTFHIQEQTSV